jgi:alpha-1,2-mannosyltransferase
VVTQSERCEPPPAERGPVGLSQLGRAWQQSTTLRILAFLLALACLVEVVLWSSGGLLVARDLHVMGDLLVYRTGGQAVLAGRSIYATTRGHFPFTYPPIGALLATLVARGSTRLVQIGWTLASLAVLGWVLYATLRRRFPSLAPSAGVVSSLAVLAVVSRTWPIYQNYQFGQVNIFLLGLCFADVVARHPRWPRGVLVGLAAAIKLVPGIFGLYFLLTGQIRAAVTSFASFLTVSLLGWLILPHDSHTYWTRIIFDTARIGSPVFYSNQSLYGIALRLSDGPVGKGIYLLAAVLVLVVGVAHARTAYRRGDLVAAAVLIGLVGICVSPISWIHHLDWIAPLLVLLVFDPTSWWRRGVGLLLLVLYSLRIPLIGQTFANDHRAVLDHILGGAGVDLFGLLVVGTVLFLPLSSSSALALPKTVTPPSPRSPRDSPARANLDAFSPSSTATEPDRHTRALQLSSVPPAQVASGVPSPGEGSG